MSLNQFTTLLRTTLKMNGIFAVNKPTGPSSADIIAQVKRALNSSKLVEGSDANTGNDKKKKFQKTERRVTNGGKISNRILLRLVTVVP